MSDVRKTNGPATPYAGPLTRFRSCSGGVRQAALFERLLDLEAERKRLVDLIEETKGKLNEQVAEKGQQRLGLQSAIW